MDRSNSCHFSLSISKQPFDIILRCCQLKGSRCIDIEDYNFVKPIRHMIRVQWIFQGQFVQVLMILEQLPSDFVD